MAAKKKRKRLYMSLKWATHRLVKGLLAACEHELQEVEARKQFARTAAAHRRLAIEYQRKADGNPL